MAVVSGNAALRMSRAAPGSGIQHVMMPIADDNLKRLISRAHVRVERSRAPSLCCRRNSFMWHPFKFPFEVECDDLIASAIRNIGRKAVHCQIVAIVT